MITERFAKALHLAIEAHDGKKENWKQRKEKYLAHLATTRSDVLPMTNKP
jgi:hypothetical protein